MKHNPAEFWNDRFGQEEFIYGTQPNEFFKEQINKLKLGSLLLPAEGEGRNAVYAAILGWQVTAFDISERGQEKALRLAKEKNVSIDYHIFGVLDFMSSQQFDVIGLCYAHFPIELRKEAHRHLINFLKPGGIIIFEAFSKAQFGNTSGGPKSKDMLFSIEEIKDEFKELKFKILKEETIQLSEGNHHKGEAEVIRFVGVKS
ncbi:class I SAM-dependent methyltransferase [Xanthomarina sp. F2636L]|uniref:class I SAM-dependent methyltransferase n=1 Tax=Xanthomarina sp. F2636L TaxID=2996018 RepID=UPI00225E2A81|nr:class I SAM-dependent methyltransferase [Xanthomarina sp. F2636L]MCX7550353.1 class I SAM-dependent methyltransferase [Xanthomarina sp. F2636L]